MPTARLGNYEQISTYINVRYVYLYELRMKGLPKNPKFYLFLNFFLHTVNAKHPYSLSIQISSKNNNRISTIAP